MSCLPAAEPPVPGTVQARPAEPAEHHRKNCLVLGDSVSRGPPFLTTAADDCVVALPMAATAARRRPATASVPRLLPLQPGRRADPDLILFNCTHQLLRG